MNFLLILKMCQFVLKCFYVANLPAKEEEEEEKPRLFKKEIDNVGAQRIEAQEKEKTNPHCHII